MSAESAVLLEVESEPGNPKRLVMTMTEDWIDVSGQSLWWSEIDRVKHSAINHHVNGSYMDTTCTIEVGTAAKQRLRFEMRSGTKGFWKATVEHDKRDRNLDEYGSALAILEEKVSIPLMTKAAMAVLEGQTIEFATVRLDRAGIHKPGLLSKSVAWGDYAGTESWRTSLKILARKGAKPKQAMLLSSLEWNVVLLPRLLGLLADQDR